jgi:predicted ATPase/class 3 adenylate cyclase/Tfp pilus assembly protein PilF
MSEHAALLLTDVVDSTALAATLGDEAMSALWAAHDRASRELLLHWRGQEMERTDGLLALFEHVADAVGYAIAYHEALHGLPVPLSARVGIHCGAITIRPTAPQYVERGARPADVDGLAKPVVARVMSLAMGGQTLLTAAARARLGDTSHDVVSHGHWHLKGVDEPIELFQVGAPGTAFQPPPDAEKVYRVMRRGDLWIPLRDLRHTMPAERNGFFGREPALQDLAQRFFHDGARLVSVLGTGGMGKTRLAQRFGWIWLGEFPGGAWFCDLSQATTLDGLVQAVAHGMDLALGQDDPVEAIGRALAGRGRCLVILDNFEQVVAFAESTLGCWLDRAAEARFLVTTREVLGIAGEATLVLGPMPSEEGCSLFAARAAAARVGFDASAEDRSAIKPLVQLLDGLPLAIELAAARVTVMPPRELLSRMSERFRLLASSGARGGRQATLRGAFDWSWNLLSAAEKSAFAQVSVFEGGFDLTAAEAVIDLSAVDGAPWVVDVVQSLVQKSLVRQVSDRRFGLLAAAQEYAADQLRTEGRFAGSGPGAMHAARVRHWRHFSEVDEERAVAGGGADIDNLVIACRRAAADADPKAAEALVRAWAALKLRGPLRSAVELAATVRQAVELGPADLATVEWVRGSALYLMGEVAQALQCLEAGLQLARQAGDRRAEARLLLALSEPMSAAAKMQDSLDSLQRALALAHEVGDRALQCKVLNLLGAWFDDQSMLDDAKARYEAALQLSHELGDRRMEGGLLGNLGGLHLVQGRLEQARESFTQALALAQQVGDRRWEGNALCNLGFIDHEQGRADDARARFQAALAIAREVGHGQLESTVLCNLGLMLESAGDVDAACRHYERAVAIGQDLGDHRSEAQIRVYLGRVYARQGRFDDARDCLATADTLIEALADRGTQALLRCSQAELAHLQDEAHEASGLLAQAERYATDSDAEADSELVRTIARLRSLLPGPGARAQVGPNVAPFSSD